MTCFSVTQYYAKVSFSVAGCAMLCSNLLCHAIYAIFCYVYTTLFCYIAFRCVMLRCRAALRCVMLSYSVSCYVTI